ncbi:MAG: flagellar export chaperone FliS [candidate division Zixibacteria bacterium]|nr:flagellar export chaperone FliS [candidate division Zixibacteria bacterium]
MNDQIRTYERIQTDGLNQKQLIVMLYNGIIRFLAEARESLNSDDKQTAQVKFEKARKIVFHLLSTLNLDAGEIALKLKSLYSFMILEITEASMRSDAEIVDRLIPIVENVKKGWEAIELNDESISPDKRKIGGDVPQRVSFTI